MASLKQRLVRCIGDLALADLREQAFLAALSLVEKEVDARDVRWCISVCLLDLSKSSKAAARSRLVVLSQALLSHGFSLNQDDIVHGFELLLQYASSQPTPSNIDEMRRLTDSFMHLFLTRLVDRLMDSLTLLSGVQDDDVRRLEAILTEKIFGSTIVPRSGGTRGSIPTSCFLILDQMLTCAKTFVHVKIVVDSCATILDKLIHTISTQSTLSLEVPEVLMPIMRAAELLSIGLKPKTCSKIVTISLKSAASKVWQVREQGFLSLATLASSVIMEDPLYPNEQPRRTVITPAVKTTSELKPAISTAIEMGRFDRIPSVRAAAHRALMALDGLPSPSSSSLGLQPPSVENKVVLPGPSRSQQQQRKRWSADVAPIGRINQGKEQPRPSVQRQSIIASQQRPLVSAPNPRAIFKPPINLRPQIDLCKKPRAAIYSAIDQASAPRHPFLKADKDKVVAIGSHSSLHWNGEARISRPRPLPTDVRDFGIIILAKPRPAPPPPAIEPIVHEDGDQEVYGVASGFNFHLDHQGEEKGSPAISHQVIDSPLGARDTEVSIHVYSSPDRSIVTADKCVSTEVSEFHERFTSASMPVERRGLQSSPAEPQSLSPVRVSPPRVVRQPLPQSSPTRSSPSISLSVSIHNNLLPPSNNGIGRSREGGRESIHQGANREMHFSPKAKGRNLDFKPLVMQATFHPQVQDLDSGSKIAESESPRIIEVEGNVLEVVYGEEGKTPAQSPPALVKVDPLIELSGMMERLEALRHHLTSSSHPASAPGSTAIDSPIRKQQQGSPNRPRGWQVDVALGNRYGTHRGSPSAAVVHVTGAMKSPNKSSSKSPHRKLYLQPPPGSYEALLSAQWRPGNLIQLEKYLS